MISIVALLAIGLYLILDEIIANKLGKLTLFEKLGLD